LDNGENMNPMTSMILDFSLFGMNLVAAIIGQNPAWRIINATVGGILLTLGLFQMMRVIAGA
jgi:hypothetical protein